MQILYWLESIRMPGLNEFMLAVTTLGEETAFLVMALIFFWCVDKRKGYYVMSVGFLGTLASQFLKLTCRVPRPWVLDPNFTILEQARAAYIGDLGVPCSGCRYCCDECPQELDIPLLIRAFNECSITGKTWRITGLTETKGPENCIQCGACMKHCPQKINIPEVLENLKEKK